MSTPEKKYLKDYTAPSHNITACHLEFHLEDQATVVHSRLHVSRSAGSTGHAPFVLDGVNLKTRRVLIDGAAPGDDQFIIEEEKLTLVDPPERFVFECEVEIDPAGNSTLEGLYRSGEILCTQCEPEGFRKITWYPDRPDVLSVFTTTIHAPKEKFPVLLSNGNLVASGDDGESHWVTWEDPFPKPSYLFALVAGDLACVSDSFETISGKRVGLEVYVAHKDVTKAGYALYSMATAMKWDEARFGREYDLEKYMIVAVDSFNHGAMENKGLNIFNSKYVLASPESATDADYEGILGVIGHEYFHNWTGNRVTLRDWFHLSLKEGLTVFRDQEFTSDLLSRGVKRIEDARHIRSVQFAEDSGPMAHAVRPDSYIEMNNFYTTTVYQKGAEVIRMEHTMIGADNFRRGMDLYFERHDGEAVIIEDFVQAMADASGFDFSQFMRWYSQAGTPEVHAMGEFNPDRGEYTLTLTQQCPPSPGQEKKEPFHIPIAMALLVPGKGEQPLRLPNDTSVPEATTRVLHLKQPHEKFVFSGFTEKPVPSLLRGFSAPVKLIHDQPLDELYYLMGHDSDSFVRWEAGQRVGTEVILRALAKGEGDVDIPEGFVEAMRAVLHDERIDGSLRSLMLALPSEAWLHEQVAVIEPQAIHDTRRGTVVALASALESDLMALYSTGHGDDTSIEFSHASLRRQANSALSWLVALERPEYIALARDQYFNSTNMTNKIAAMMMLSGIACDARGELLEHFYATYKDHFLLVNKWLTVQALSPLPGTLDEVRRLAAHESFEITNPNKARALIGGFASNRVRFHDISGDGYRFLGEMITTLNSINPIVASRLITPLTRFKRHTPGRRAQMVAVLQDLLALENLSRDLYEIVSKSLDQA